MRRERTALLLLAAVIVAATGAGFLASSALGWANAGPARSHTLFHIGCMHHDHGPAWRHGRDLTAGHRRLGAGAVAEPPLPLRLRALAAGR